MLFQIQNGTLSFGEKIILSHVDMEIKGKEKIGIVGSNGTGKTSLLKLIAGELELDRDDKRQGKGIICSRKLWIATLPQDHTPWLKMTVEDILLEGFYENPESERQKDEMEHLYTDYSQERFFYEQRYDKLLRAFGFAVEDKGRLLQEFSGGEQTKLMLVKLLLTEADLLLLDEPTNHLDGESVEALEEYLTEYPGAVVVVSHDRYFLDKVAEVIYELEDATLSRYPGNYSAYRFEKRKQRDLQRKAYERQQEEIERNEQLIRQFKNKPRKAAFARSRRTMLERMERVEKPKEDMGHIFTGELKPEYPGPKWMLQMEKLQVGFKDQNSLLGELDLRIKRGQKIGIIGKNGVGKSTLLKTLTGQLNPLKGKYLFGEKVDVGYFDQNSGQFDSEEKVAEYFHRLFPGMSDKELYGKLAAFLFKGSICQHKINTLSGGEKTRLKLCELMTVCPNFLILDEPTNHMDIPAKETLESAFQAYTGTMLIVSHDRFFLDQVADAILVLEDGAAFYYPFGYTHYVKSKKRMNTLLEKGVSLEDLPGMLSAQDQAMVASLKAVPKAEYHETKPLSDEAAYFDWKLRLASEPMEEARFHVQNAYAKYEATKISYQEFLLAEYGNMGGIDGLGNMELEKKKEAMESAAFEFERENERWTAFCLTWYDIIQEME